MAIKIKHALSLFDRNKNIIIYYQGAGLRVQRTGTLTNLRIQKIFVKYGFINSLRKVLFFHEPHHTVIQFTLSL